MKSDVSVRVAGEEELAVATEILQEAAHWLTAQGMYHWDPHFLNADFLRPYVEAGELHLAWRGGEGVGMFLLQQSDPEFWPDAEPDSSYFIHKLIVRRAVAGTGVSQFLLEAARAEARAAGRQWLRLDCANHPRLRAFYEAAGFTLRDIRQIGDWTAVRYEMSLTSSHNEVTP